MDTSCSEMQLVARSPSPGGTLKNIQLANFRPYILESDCVNFQLYFKCQVYFYF